MIKQFMVSDPNVDVTNEKLNFQRGYCWKENAFTNGDTSAYAYMFLSPMNKIMFNEDDHLTILPDESIDAVNEGNRLSFASMDLANSLHYEKITSSGVCEIKVSADVLFTKYIEFVDLMEKVIKAYPDYAIIVTFHYREDATVTVGLSTDAEIEAYYGDFENQMELFGEENNFVLSTRTFGGYEQGEVYLYKGNESGKALFNHYFG